MKFFKTILIALGSIILPFAATAAGPMELKIDATKAGAPISPFIYGQFVEHLGRCIYGGIWAEMLEDRKFYFPITANYSPYKSLTNSAFPVVGASPWQIIGDPSAVTMVKEDTFVGDHSPRINSGAGIRQRDLGRTNLLNKTMGASGERSRRSSSGETSQTAFTLSSDGNMTASGFSSRYLRSRRRRTAASS